MVTPSTCAADTLKMWSSLPPFVQDQDASNGYPWLSFLDGPGQQLQQIDNLCRDNGLIPGWSILLDVSRCPTNALPWLAQFVGTRFQYGQTLTDLQQRELILTPPGWGRGTVAAIKQAAGAFLSAGYSATVLERDADPYQINVIVPLIGAGGQTYSTLDNSAATYTALDAEFATYSAMIFNPTPITSAILAAIPAGVVGTVSFV